MGVGRTGSVRRTADTAEEVWVRLVALDAAIISAIISEYIDKAEEQTEKVHASSRYWRLTEILMASMQHRSQLQGT